jgi:hypothetical protein
VLDIGEVFCAEETSGMLFLLNLCMLANEVLPSTDSTMAATRGKRLSETEPSTLALLLVDVFDKTSSDAGGRIFATLGDASKYR